MMRQEVSILVVLMLLWFHVAKAFGFGLLVGRGTESLAMGGYYSEPDDLVGLSKDDRPKHMVFGTKCVEESVEMVGLTPIKYLQLEGDDEEINIRFIKDLVLHVDFSNKNVVELGASVVSMITARLHASHVTAYDSDEGRLRILQYADCYVNVPSSCQVQVVKTSMGSSLPASTDLIIVTADLSRHETHRLVQEAISQSIPIVTASGSPMEANLRNIFPSATTATTVVDELCAVDPLTRLSWKGNVSS